MLSKEQADQQLKQHTIANWSKDRQAKLKKLPKKAGEATRVLVFERYHWRKEDEYKKKAREAAAQLDKLSVKDRTAAFAALFPKLAPHIEVCWQRKKTEPFRINEDYLYDATPFRMPANPEASLVDRGLWLRTLTENLKQTDEDIVWLARWAPHLATYHISEAIGDLLASAIDAGGKDGQAVMQVLIDSANGEDEIGQMGSHVTRGLMCCANEHAWDYMEKFLLAAQRQEGLRQAILETVDEAHPQLFRRMLRLILEKNLVRFASVVRAADVWFALRWDSASTKVIKESIERALFYIDDPAAQKKALSGTDPTEAYFALWAQGIDDASVATKSAVKLLKHDKPEMRFTGGWMIKMMRTPEGLAQLATLLDDPELELVNLAVDDADSKAMREQNKVDVFAKLEALIDRVPKKPKKLKAYLFPWLDFKLQQSEVADAMAEYIDEERFERFIPYVTLMSPDGRDTFVAELGKKKEMPPSARSLVIKLTGDASSYVRDQAIKVLSKGKLKPEEAPELEKLLTRKANSLRRGLIKLLKNQPTDGALASVDRLVAAKNKMQRAAGVELIAELSSDKDAAAACKQRAQAYAEAQKELTDVEETLLGPLLGIVDEKPTLDNALGLMDPEKLTRPRPMKKGKTPAMTQAAVNLVQSLDDLIHKHREKPVTVWDYEGETEKLLGNIEWGGLVSWDAPDEVKEGDKFPLAEFWQQWYDKRPKACKDKDGFEFLRARVFLMRVNDYGKMTSTKVLEQVSGLDLSNFKLKYLRVVVDVFDWLEKRVLTEPAIDFILDAAETGLGLLSEQKFLTRWLCGSSSIYTAWLAKAQQAYDAKSWSESQVRRLVSLYNWVDKPTDAHGMALLTETDVKAAQDGAHPNPLRYRNRMDKQWFVLSFQLGMFNEHDVYDMLIGPREKGYLSASFDLLQELSSRRPSDSLKMAPELKPYAEAARDRVIEVELARGEAPTAASNAATNLRYIPGAKDLARLLNAMGKTAFARGYSYSYGDSGQDRKSVFSEMIRVSGPTDKDTAASFKAEMKAAGITDKRLIEVGMYAPQWAGLIEQALKWDGFEDAVWWVHAHTKDDQWSVEEEVKEQWKAAVSERTPLEDAELIDGAVDVNWFLATYDRLKKSKWAQIDAAAKNASSSGGHKRAQLFADAMLGNVTKTELLTRIKDKRHKDAVRALGLLPLQRGKSREKDLLSRYEVMQDFVRTSKQFGQQRQASEKRASEIGQANLARTAGYPDPVRLQWAMEAKAVEDLASGSLTVSTGEIDVTLSISETGEPSISVLKAGKTLKSVPAKAKKDTKIKELTTRKTALKRQASRMRKSLEQMMCRAEVFEGAELAMLCEHPLMRPMLERLVFIGEGIIGFPEKGGKVLVDHAGKAEPVKKKEKLRIAHPHDLLDRGDWSKWQQGIFKAERVQPFKQVYRELYVLTKAEKKDKKFSKRYAGQQVNPSQAIALLGGRGWVTLPEEGVRKTFHDVKLSAWLEFQESFYTPAEIDGLTLENVRFSKAGEWKGVDIATVPPLIFSEVMRDMDLVVSVAHRGGIDPEASASTVEMRSDLLRETLAVLDIENVRIENNHALIKGDHGNYSVHLGSAVTHLMPGGSIFMVPVHSQHRGRLFLPFADDDPKTAEVISKTLMLSRDNEIKDPSLLDQIRIRKK
jgi:hypothetical protein